MILSVRVKDPHTYWPRRPETMAKIKINEKAIKTLTQFEVSAFFIRLCKYFFYDSHHIV